MTRTTTIDIALPVLNEQRCLERNVRSLLAKLPSAVPVRLVDLHRRQREHRRVVGDRRSDCADGAERPGPPARGARSRPGPQGGLDTSSADIVAYMDIDLSTDLAALGPLVDAIAAVVPTSPSAPAWPPTPRSPVAPDAKSSPISTT